MAAVKAAAIFFVGGFVRKGATADFDFNANCFIVSSVTVETYAMSQPETTEILLELPTDMVAAVDRIASILGGDRFFVLQQAVGAYLDHQGADLLDEAQGLDELDRGESVDLDDTLAKARAIVEAAESRRGTRFG